MVDWLARILQMNYQMHQVDVLEFLESYDGERFHAVFADPPYNLSFMGKKFDTFENNQAYQEWATEWGKLLIENALYPNAICLFYGGTRTVHRLTAGLEDAGFQIYDTINTLVSYDEKMTAFYDTLDAEQQSAFLELIAPAELLAYVYGSGMPKPVDISKAIDRHLGQEREVVGSKLGQPGYSLADNLDDRTAYGAFTDAEKEVSVTAPATQAAQLFQDYHAHLSPAWEPLVLCRVPRESTYAESALEYGTGALNIGGTRVGWENEGVPEIGMPAWGGPQKKLNATPTSEGETVERKPPSPSGRWPDNLTLRHHPDCRKVGVRRARGDKRGVTGGKAQRQPPGENEVYGTFQGTDSTPAYGIEHKKFWIQKRLEQAQELREELKGLEGQLDQISESSENG